MALRIDYYPIANVDVGSNLYNGYRTRNYQSFTGTGVPLTCAVLWAKKVGAPTGNITAVLKAHSGTYGTSSVPTGDALATSDTVDITTLSTTYGVLYLWFATPYTLVNGTYYCLEIQYSGGDASNYLVIGCDWTSPTHGGNWGYYTTSYTYNAAIDMCFYAYSGTLIYATGAAATDSGTTITPVIPAGIRDGDVMKAIVYHRTGSTNFSCTAGWDEDYDAASQTTGSFAVFSRVYVAGDGNPTITATNSQSLIAVIIVFRDCPNLYDVAVAGAAFAAPSDPFDVTIPSFNTTVDGSVALFLWGSIDNNTWVYQSGGGSAIFAAANTTGLDNSLYIATENIFIAGATDDQVARQTALGGDAGRYLYFALKAVAGETHTIGGTVASTTAYIIAVKAGWRIGCSAASTTGFSASRFVRRFITLETVAASSAFTAAATLIEIVYHTIGAAVASTTDFIASVLRKTRIGGLVSSTTDFVVSITEALAHIIGGAIASTTSVVVTVVRKSVLGGSISGTSGFSVSTRMKYALGASIAATSTVSVALYVLGGGITHVVGAVIVTTGALVSAVFIHRYIGGSIGGLTSAVVNAYRRRILGAITGATSGVMAVIRAKFKVGGITGGLSALASNIYERSILGGTVAGLSNLLASSYIRYRIGVVVAAASNVVSGIYVRYIVGGVVVVVSGMQVVVTVITGAAAEVGRALINTYRYVVRHTTKSLHVGTESKDDNIED